MKICEMRIAGVLTACLLGLVSLVQPGRLMAQPAAPAPAPATAGIHGHVTSPLGQAITEGEVRLTTDRNTNSVNRKFEYTFPLDASGNYKGAGIKPGNYVAAVFTEQRPRGLHACAACGGGRQDGGLRHDAARSTSTR